MLNSRYKTDRHSDKHKYYSTEWIIQQDSPMTNDDNEHKFRG